MVSAVQAGSSGWLYCVFVSFSIRGFLLSVASFFFQRPRGKSQVAGPGLNDMCLRAAQSIFSFLIKQEQELHGDHNKDNYGFDCSTLRVQQYTGESQKT